MSYPGVAIFINMQQLICYNIIYDKNTKFTYNENLNNIVCLKFFAIKF